MTGGLAVLAAMAAHSGWAGDTLPRFGWGVPVERTQETLGGLVSAPAPCTSGWMGTSRECRALVIEQHRLGRHVYRLELQHRSDAGLYRILVMPAARNAQTREVAIAYAILVFDAAFAESHGRLTSFPVFRHIRPDPGKSQAGYEWHAQYGPPAVRVRLHARSGTGGEGDTGLAIER